MQQVLCPYYVWMAAWAAVTWGGTLAHAQYTDFGHVGDHLVFAYWSVEDDTNTNVAVHAHRGVRDSKGEETPAAVAQVAVRDRMGKIATEFKICLMPGDSWTATLTAGGLRVGDPGECDERIHQGGGTRTGQLVVTPKPGEVIALGAATSGWLDVWQTPAKALKDGPDEDTEPDHVTDKTEGHFVSGEATLVSPRSGFASTYNARAVRLCGDKVDLPATGDDPTSSRSGYLSWWISATYPDETPSDASDDRVDTGDGCWKIDQDGDGDYDTDRERHPLLYAVAGTRRSLLGRWTALSDENVWTYTKVVLTFPQTPLRYEGKNAEGAEVMGTDPLSLLVFDTKGELVLDSRAVLLGQNVNVCTFAPTEAMEDAPGMMPGLSCNGERVGPLQGTSGGFRFFNNTAVVIDDAGTVTNDGTEATDLSVKKATAADGSGMGGRPKGGQVPDANYRFGVVGLVFSYFRGTDGVEYDQVTQLGMEFTPAKDSDDAVYSQFTDPHGTAEDERTDNPFM